MTNVEIASDMTLQEARDLLREQWGKGVACPCCTQWVQLYRRTINAAMAVSLIKMYRAAGRDWQHVPTTVGRMSAEEGKLRYWGLVEESPEPRGDGGRAGWWRITEKGELFVLDRIEVPRYALVFDQRCFGMDGSKGDFGIVTALKGKFDYRKLMDGQA